MTFFLLFVLVSKRVGFFFFFFPHRFSKGTGVLCIYTHTRPNNYLAMEMRTLCPYFAFES